MPRKPAFGSLRTPTIRRRRPCASQPRLVYQQAMYQRLIDISPSPSNMLEFCLGTLAEMTEGDLYETVDNYSGQHRIAYVHFRNIAGKAPHYHETFIDDGDVDMLRILWILHKNGFDGVIIPDHAPQMTCSAPWHAGMAHTLGFLARGHQRRSSADLTRQRAGAEASTVQTFEIACDCRRPS